MSRKVKKIEVKQLIPCYCEPDDNCTECENGYREVRVDVFDLLREKDQKIKDLEKDIFLLIRGKGITKLACEFKYKVKFDIEDIAWKGDSTTKHSEHE